MFRSMSEAPKDGTRILIWERLHGFCQREREYQPTGERLVEAWFSQGRWQEWCGERTQSTATIDPLGWAPLPAKEFEVRV